MNIFEHLVIPDFKEYIQKPHSPTCPIIDCTRLMVEILGASRSAGTEFNQSTYSNKMLIDGSIALVIRYQREKDNTYRPACTISFNQTPEGIHIQQIQGSNDKSVAFRFHSSFNTTGYLLKLIEESFIKKGILVNMELFPCGLENASYASRASQRYEVFRSGIEGLKTKYQRQIAN
ncbi:hypothetical protein K2X92_06070 [Candidatus Gracilibacteria bacterium]|nr:hypothetical protein [Candidatus Gracilibacteria bacterium]